MIHRFYRKPRHSAVFLSNKVEFSDYHNKYPGMSRASPSRRTYFTLFYTLPKAGSALYRIPSLSVYNRLYFIHCPIVLGIL